MVDDALFGPLVGIGHKVNRVFVFYVKSAPGILQQQATGQSASVYGNRQQPCGRDNLFLRFRHAAILTRDFPPSRSSCMATSLFFFGRH
jgi:hypothetical protein